MNFLLAFLAAFTLEGVKELGSWLYMRWRKTKTFAIKMGMRIKTKGKR